MMATVHEMLEMGFTPTEIDQITGKAIGHASSATFRTSDLVGLDVLAHVNKNLYPAVPDDEDREVFHVPDVINKMLEKNILATRPAGASTRNRETRRQTCDPGTRSEHVRIQAAGENEVSLA
jgi:3-hydroxyacyl-CoA dehydrogenase